jgi:hypothetical protein
LPKYGRAVIDAGKKGLADGTIRPGNLYVIDVHHDDWCDLLAGRGPCNCEPEVDVPQTMPLPGARPAGNPAGKG